MKESKKTYVKASIEIAEMEMQVRVMAGSDPLGGGGSPSSSDAYRFNLDI